MHTLHRHMAFHNSHILFKLLELSSIWLYTHTHRLRHCYIILASSCNFFYALHRHSLCLMAIQYYKILEVSSLICIHQPLLDFFQTPNELVLIFNISVYPEKIHWLRMILAYCKSCVHEEAFRFWNFFIFIYLFFCFCFLCHVFCMFNAINLINMWYCILINVYIYFFLGSQADQLLPLYLFLSVRQFVISVYFTYVCYVCFSLCVGLLCLFLLSIILFFLIELLNVTKVGKGSPSWNQHFKYICIDSRFNPLLPFSMLLVLLLS